MIGAIELYEKFVNEEFVNIKLYSSTSYLFKTRSGKEYNVNIKSNKVYKSIPDPVWD
jgi:hypothetical protein